MQDDFVAVFDEESVFSGDPFVAYKIYSDGAHLIGTKVRQGVCQRRRVEDKEVVDSDVFDDLFFDGYIQRGLRSKALAEHISAGILADNPDQEDVADLVEDGIKRKLNNIQHRKKRFRRKAYLNQWNYFVTFTYDDDKQSEETFKAKIRKCLSNFHTRRGWKYMGVFERGSNGDRLHFHGLFYIPDGEMVGRNYEQKKYSTKRHSWESWTENSFFAFKFGQNMWEDVNSVALRHGKAIDYILKYIGKTGERLVYSRGIPTEICKGLTGDDIITEMVDTVVKYILFDDVLDSDRDIGIPLRYDKPKPQSTMVFYPV